MWKHPHIITSLYVTHHSSHFSSEHPSSHRHIRRLLKASSSTLSLPPSLSRWPNGPPENQTWFNRPCPPAGRASQWQTRPAANNQNKRRAFWKPGSRQTDVRQTDRQVWLSDGFGSIDMKKETAGIQRSKTEEGERSPTERRRVPQGSLSTEEGELLLQLCWGRRS